MCIRTRHFLICVCRWRNHPSCSHHRYILDPDGPDRESNLKPLDGQWFNRFPNLPQSCIYWIATARETWTPCEEYKKTHPGDKSAPPIVPEDCRSCPSYSESPKELVPEKGLCRECNTASHQNPDLQRVMDQY